jgi:hypothetical protein
MIEYIKTKGEVEAIKQYKNGDVEKFLVHNTILRTGRYALANSLANRYGDQYDYYISNMIFGENGTSGGTPKYVNTERNGLFGPTILSKGVISTVDTTTPSIVTFTSVVAFDEANGHNLNEMALRMASGDLYSMVTFADLGKTSSIQIVFNWRCSFV